MSRRSGRKQFRAVMVRKEVTGADVLQFLRRNPGFLTEHAAEIDLPYADSDDGTVSVSRIRQEAMRKQISSLSESLSDTRDIAEGNQEIADIFFRICRVVIGAESVGELSSIVNETCRTELLEGLTGFIGAALAKLVDQGRDAEGRAIAPISVVE